MTMISPHCVDDEGWVEESLASGPLVNGQKGFSAIVIQESSQEGDRASRNKINS